MNYILISQKEMVLLNISNSWTNEMKSVDITNEFALGQRSILWIRKLSGS